MFFLFSNITFTCITGTWDGSKVSIMQVTRVFFFENSIFTCITRTWHGCYAGNRDVPGLGIALLPGKSLKNYKKSLKIAPKWVLGGKRTAIGAKECCPFFAERLLDPIWIHFGTCPGTTRKPLRGSWADKSGPKHPSKRSKVGLESSKMTSACELHH